jgi:hypothetical protein
MGHHDDSNGDSGNPSQNQDPYVTKGEHNDYKYLMLKVPDYEGTRDGSDKKVSYLRMGANPRPQDNVTEEGSSLVDKAKNAIRNGKQSWFIDDTRDRGDGEAGIDARHQVSNQLVAKCGWRDHSDGNRISTTGGDKIEVIRGNYKLLVLGRQDSADDAVMFDASGGLLQDDDIAPGAISSIKWVQDQGGTWKVQEETEKGDVKIVFHGQVEEHFYGPLIKTVIGSADEATISFESEKANPATKQRPEIQEDTYASKIRRYTRIGTSPRFADADLFENSTTNVPGDNSVLEIIDCQGTLETRIVASTIKDRRGQALHGCAYENEVYGTTNENWYGHFFETFVGAMESLRLAGFSMELNAALVAMEIFVAKSFQIFAGACTEITLARKVEISCAEKAEFEPGGSTKFSAFIKKNAGAIFLG